MRIYSIPPFLVLIYLLGWAVSGLLADPGPLPVFVSIPPQTEFVKRVGGERVAVQVLLDKGQSPHSFDPSPRALARLGEARLFFRVGVPYEERIAGRLASAFANLEVVDTRAGIELRHLEGDSHGHEGDDPHIWLDPKLVKVQAATIRDALIRADGAGEAQYRLGGAAYAAALDSLDNELRKILAPFAGREVYVYHPAFGYLLEAYGLRQAPVQLGGHEPAARELAALVDKMRSEGVRTMFVQPEFPSPVADALNRALGCSIVRLDPLAADYTANMRRMAWLLAGALSGNNK